MITLKNVYKKYRSNNSRWVLEDLSLQIPKKTNIGLIGRNGSGKSTLLRIIAGIDRPNKGKVNRDCNVSWPMGYGGGLQGSLTGKQNAKFVCRIHGIDNYQEKVAYIKEFSELGYYFDQPVKTYSSGMKSRLQFAMSMAIDFDVYISDEVTAAGDAAFRKKAKDEFAKKTSSAGLIMVSHGEATLKDFCQQGLLLDKGKGYWFEDINDALVAYKESIKVN